MKKRSKNEEACLLCGKIPVQARGLCATHHTRFHRQMRQLNPEDQKVYEQTLIDRGLLLRRKSPGRQVQEDPFRDIADELFVAEPKPSFDEQEKSSSTDRPVKKVTKRGKSSSTKTATRKKKR